MHSMCNEQMGFVSFSTSLNIFKFFHKHMIVAHTVGVDVEYDVLIDIHSLFLH